MESRVALATWHLGLGFDYESTFALHVSCFLNLALSLCLQPLLCFYTIVRFDLGPMYLIILI